jgi:hypothetical protein
MPVRFVIRCISLLAITSGPSLLRCGLRVTLSTECAHAEVASGDTLPADDQGRGHLSACRQRPGLCE